MSKRAHSKEPKLKRRRPFREEKETFLIFCEGENTEPYYFNAFKLKTATIKPISIRNNNALLFVKNAIKQKARHGSFDNYWIVFDKDNNTNANFNAAITEAEGKGFKVAYSNASFEYWYLCHFTHTSACHKQNELETALSKHLKQKYSKDVKFAAKLYELLLDKQATAIGNAEKIIKQLADNSNPALACSSTTVHLLVKELNKHLD